MKNQGVTIKGGSLFATGSVAKNDFAKCGYVSVVLQVTNVKIMVISVAGFCSDFAPEKAYYFNPKNKSELSKNETFVSLLESSSEETISIINNIISNNSTKAIA